MTCLGHPPIGTKSTKSCAELTNDWCPTDQVLILPGAEFTYHLHCIQTLYARFGRSVLKARSWPQKHCTITEGWTGGTLIHSPASLLLSPTPFLISSTLLHLSPFPLFLSPAPSLLFPVSLYTVHPLITYAQTGQKNHNEYKNTFRNFVANLPVSAILV